MKNLLAGALVLLGLPLLASNVQLRVEAPDLPDQQATLYVYMDLFTRRLEPIAKGTTDAHGSVLLEAEMAGTKKALLVVGHVGAELWLRDRDYHVRIPSTTPDNARIMGGIVLVYPVFPGLDLLDVNALTSDLNLRLDEFVAEGLATDHEAGMEAITRAREGKEELEPDTAKTARDLYLAPTWGRERVDTFASKLNRYYAMVDDPWFHQNVEYGIAGLYLGPKANDRELFNRFLKDKPVLYDVPEYVRFFSAFFHDHLLRFPFRSRTEELQQALRAGQVDSLKALLAQNDFLRDGRLNELVLITNLYENAAHPELDRQGILEVLRQVRDHSAYPEHRQMADNMLWDLTAMTKGTGLPMALLLDADGRPMRTDSLFTGYTCLMIMKVGNPYSDQEIVAMDQLVREYGNQVRFVYVVLDRTVSELSAWRKADRGHGGLWTVAADQRGLLDLWRVKNAPVLFLLKDQTLIASPGPLPSQGLVAELHRLRVEWQREQELNRGSGRPAPRR